MIELFETLKPAASIRTHLLLAALMWSVVGTLLLAFGMDWTLVSLGARAWLAAALGLLVGQLKAHFVLRHAAARMIARIEARGDGRCIGGFLSPRTWGFVGLMMVGGYELRHGPAPHMVVGFLYVAVGAALLSASRCFWGAWHRRRRRAG